MMEGWLFILNPINGEIPTFPQQDWWSGSTHVDGGFFSIPNETDGGITISPLSEMEECLRNTRQIDGRMFIY